MHRISPFIVTLLIPAVTFAQTSTVPISRYDAFEYTWNSLHRAVGTTSETPYTDVPSSDPMYKTIRFAKSRNILGDFETFRPNDSLDLITALIWLFRSRNLADPEEITEETLPEFLAEYQIARLPEEGETVPDLTESQFLFLMQSLDEQIATTPREMSLYSEKFHGKGTAFGESFDMYAMTAANKYLPHNTLVLVTNVDNGKSVTVRINDRGPYVKDRYMDLSLGAFTTIADRLKGVIHATMQRLGDVNIVGPCVQPPLLQKRITRDTILAPGLPRIVHMGTELTLSANKSFVVRSVTYPDGFVSSMQNWILTGETFTLKPSMLGDYTFHLSSASGRNREMTMKVVECAETAESSEATS